MKKVQILFLSMLFLFSNFLSVSAQENICDPITGTCGGAAMTVPVFIGQIAMKPFLALAGVAAFALFVYGGARMMFSMGNPKEVEEGKKIITNVVKGLLIMFSAYAIVDLFIRFLQAIKG